MRVGILGCGRMGNERARSSVGLGHELVFVYDQDAERARAMATKYGASKAIFNDADIRWSALDAAFICTPPAHRCVFELPAIEAHLPFFVEKPIAVRASDCMSVLAALRSNPVIHAVGYMNRYRSSVLFARKLLTRGNVLGVCCHWIGRQYKVNWWLDQKLSGGPLNEQATHAFDLCRSLVGEVESVSATSRPSPSSSELALTVACTLNFTNGQLGTILYSCEASEKQIDLRVITAEGMLELSGWDLRISANTIDDIIPELQEEDIFLKETDQFLKAVLHEDPALIHCDLADAYRTQLVVDAAVASLRSGMRTSVGVRAQLENS
jgi:myo-inositol 2-dehydrogenase/D-chiro-inositol 1-dehydrogenase